MKTIYVKMTEEKIDIPAILQAGEILRGGGLVAFPTETVYGLGGDAFNPSHPERFTRRREDPRTIR